MLAQTAADLRDVALEAPDASGYFPALYARVTQQVDRAVADDRFGDELASERIVAFAQEFARWYLRPRRGEAPVARSWQATWDAGDGLLVVQHLLLGINAHVNHDLGRVVVELADRAGGPDQLEAIKPGFDAINEVLAETYPLVLHDLGRVARWVGAADRRGGGAVFNFSLRVARRQAWALAERLAPLGGRARATEVAKLDDMVSALAYLIADPGWPASWLIPVARLFERRDPREVTRVLLGDLGS